MRMHGLVYLNNCFWLVRN